MSSLVFLNLHSLGNTYADFFFFETGLLCVALAIQEFTLYNRWPQTQNDPSTCVSRVPGLKAASLPGNTCTMKGTLGKKDKKTEELRSRGWKRMFILMAPSSAFS